MYANPYRDLAGGVWRRTNLHAHAGTGPGTCGKNPLDEVVGVYREMGYGALCISNHDLYTETSALGDAGMILIPGVEYSRDEHMLTIGTRRSLHGLPHQEAIDETARQGGFTVLCHPHWIREDYWRPERIDALRGFAGLEVLNMLIYRLEGSGRATDVWDRLLRQGRLAFGFGSDDFHAWNDAGRACTDIHTVGDTAADVLSAVEQGRFTVSSGLRLERLTLADDVVTVRAAFLRPTHVRDFAYRFVTENGTASEVFGESADFRLRGEDYVRVEVLAENGALLFTQPVYRTERFRRP